MSRRRGNDNENAFCEEVEALGYCAYPARGSRGIVDVVCFQAAATSRIIEDRVWFEGKVPPGPPLVVQVGTQNKSVARTLDELEAAPRPIGSLAIVARRMAKRRTFPFDRPWRYHTRAGTFDSLEAAITERTR